MPLLSVFLSYCYMVRVLQIWKYSPPPGPACLISIGHFLQFSCVQIKVVWQIFLFLLMKQENIHLQKSLYTCGQGLSAAME